MTASIDTASAAAAAWRRQLGRLLERPNVQRAIVTLIVVNAAVLGLQTSTWAVQQFGTWLDSADRVILVVFVVEISLRFVAQGRRFFRDPWNWFDAAVVGVSLVPSNAPLAVLRGLRVLRVLRLVAVAPRLRRVVGAMLAAIPGLVATLVVLALVFYVFGVIGTHLFGEGFPAWFGSLGRTVYTLFQVMTLESWSMGISRPVMERFPFAWMFFVPFILTATYTVLNLFVAIIVGATQEQATLESEAAAAASPEPAESPLIGELRQLRAEVAELRALLERRAAS